MNSKFALTTFLLFMIINTVTSQTTWFEKDATWHYKFSSTWEGYGYEKMAYDSDTLIEGKLCKKLLRDVYFLSVQTKNIEHKKKRAQFVYQSGDTIWQYRNNTFQQLYNFSLKIGDTIPFMNFHTLQNNINILSDIQTITINDQQLRQQTIDVYGNDQLITKMNIVEKIGVTSFPFSFFWNEFLVGISDFPAHEFRCYSDHLTPTINYSNRVCDALQEIVGTDEMEGQELSFFPNPCTDMIFLKNISADVSYKIYNIQGAELMSGLTKSVIDVNGLERGMYLLKIDERSIKKFIKE